MNAALEFADYLRKSTSGADESVKEIGRVLGKRKAYDPVRLKIHVVRIVQNPHPAITVPVLIPEMTIEMVINNHGMHRAFIEPLQAHESVVGEPEF